MSKVLPVTDGLGRDVIVVTKTKHLGVLDLLRGFAAVVVLLFHFTSSRGLVKFYSPIASSLFTWGNMGVEIFFVISGFIIPYSLWGTRYKPSEFFRFMAKRVVRIAPPAYICLILVLIQWMVVDHFIKHDIISRLADSAGIQIIRNLLFSYSWMSPYWVNPVFWTLAIEFQFYLIIGLLYNLLFEQKNVFAFILFFVLLTGAYLIVGFSKFSISGYSPMFAMGGATLLFKKESISAKQYFAMLLLFFIIMAVNFDYLPAVFGVATALTIAFIKIQHSVFSFFGKISYSLYLLHLLVGGTTEFLLAKVYHPHTELGNLAAISFCVAVVLAFSYAYYQLVEVPFMKLGRRLKL